MSDDLSFFADFDPRGGAAAAPPAATTSDEWMCGACTFLNPLSVERCKVCDTPMPVMDLRGAPATATGPAPASVASNPSTPVAISPIALASPASGEKGGSGPLRRKRTNSKKDSEKAVRGEKTPTAAIGLSVSETGLNQGSPSKDSGSHALTPAAGASPMSPGATTTLEKKKSRTLFSLGRNKKKEEKKEESPEKEDKKNEAEDEHAHHKEKEKEKEEEKEERRKRAGSFRGWVTRKGRKGDKDDDEGQADAKDQGKESETEDEQGEPGEVSGDWRAIMATKRSVLIILDNLSDETLMRRGAGKLSTGNWGRYPPAIIPPHGVIDFGAYGTTLKGTKGRCIYTIDGYDSTFIFQWSNSKVGAPEVRCMQHPQEFKVESRGRIEKSAEVTFSIFLASAPKPKRPEGAPSADGSHSTPSGALSPPPFPVFDNLLDDAEVQAVETFVQSQTAASFGSTPREGNTPVPTPPTSGGFPTSVHVFDSESSNQPLAGSSRTHPINPFLDPSNPFAQPAVASTGPMTADWTAEGDDDWSEDEQPTSPGPKLKFSIKSKDEISTEPASGPEAFRLSSPPPAASGSKQTRRRGGGSAQGSSDTIAVVSSGGSGGGGGLVFRHTGPENKGEATTPVTARAARLVQRKTGPSGSNGSARLKRDDLGDSRGAVAVERKERSDAPKTPQKDVLFEVGRNDPPHSPSMPSVGPALSAAAPAPTLAQPATPLSVASPTPAMSAAKADAAIRQASNMMLTCGTRMQTGQFREAFLDAENALDLLRSVSDVNSVLKPLKICIDYKLAILLLMEIDAFSKHSQQTTEEATMIKQRVAVLAKHLATLRLTPQHAAIAVRMAISKNIDAQNYGVASNLLQLVLSRNPPDAAYLNEKLHLCKQHDETNAMSNINRSFCCQTLRLVEQSDQTAACPVCGSLYAASSVGDGARCPLCSSAAVVIR